MRSSFPLTPRGFGLCTTFRPPGQEPIIERANASFIILPGGPGILVGFRRDPGAAQPGHELLLGNHSASHCRIVMPSVRCAAATLRANDVTSGCSTSPRARSWADIIT